MKTPGVHTALSFTPWFKLSKGPRKYCSKRLGREVDVDIDPVDDVKRWSFKFIQFLLCNAEYSPQTPAPIQNNHDWQMRPGEQAFSLHVGGRARSAGGDGVNQVSMDDDDLTR